YPPELRGLAIYFPPLTLRSSTVTSSYVPTPERGGSSITSEPAPSGRGSPRSAAGAADLPDPRVDLRAQHGQAIGSGAQERVGEALGVETPPLDERRDAEVLAELGQPRELLRERDLDVVARDRFVKRERLDLVPRPGLRLERVDVVGARAAAVDGGRAVVRDG